MVIESSIVIFRSTMFSNASLKMGYPPIKAAAMPTTLMCGNGSHTRNQTAPAANATKAMRMSSTHSNPCSGSACFESFLGRFISGEAGLSERGEVARVFSTDCGALIGSFPR